MLFGKLPRLSYGIREIPGYLAPQQHHRLLPARARRWQQGRFLLRQYLRPQEPPAVRVRSPLHARSRARPSPADRPAAGDGRLPEFRRFTNFTAYVEGWALYAERLGLEVGFYRDPYSDFGRLTYEMWRACRLVVDTGMHAFGWTRQQAIDFMAENSALALLNIANEVDRYIAWPGQALAYKIGELKIRELRALAERELGAGFDRRAFHDLVLSSGPVPLVVLEQQVREWIERQKRLPGEGI